MVSVTEDFLKCSSGRQTGAVVREDWSSEQGVRCRFMLFFLRNLVKTFTLLTMLTKKDKHLLNKKMYIKIYINKIIITFLAPSGGQPRKTP